MMPGNSQHYTINYQPLDVTPGEHYCMRALLRFFSAKHNVVSNGVRPVRLLHAIRKAVEIIKKVVVQGGGRFDLDGCNILTLFDERINFKSSGFPIVKQVGSQPAVHAGFVDFRDNPAFKNCPAKRVKTKSFWFADTF